MKILFASNSFKLDDSHKEKLGVYDVSYFENKEEIEKLIDYDGRAKEDYVLVCKPGSFVGEWNLLPADKLIELKRLKGVVLGTTSKIITKN